MQGIGFFRQFDAGRAIHALERNRPVKRNLIFGVQVQVQLLDLPGAICNGGCGEFILVCCQFNAVLGGFGNHHVLLVAILAIGVLRHNDFRFVLPIQPYNPFVDFVFAARRFIGCLETFSIAVLEIANDRIRPHAHVPQTIEQLGGAGGVGAAEVRHNHLALLLDSVGGNRAAEENQLIIRVRGEEENIRLLFRRLPYLHPVGQIALRKHKQFVDAQGSFLLACHRQADILRRLRQRNIRMEEARVARHGGEPVLAVVAGLDFPRFRHVAEADIKPGNWLALRRGDCNPWSLDFVALPIGGILLVRHLRVFPPGTAHLELAVLRDIIRFRGEGNAQAQREQRQQRYQPFLHNQCHFLSMILQLKNSIK